MSETKEKASFFRRLFFSERLERSSKGLKIAYIAMVTAIAVAENSLLELKFGTVQFSLTLFLSAFAGIFLGGVAGFFACFLGDGIGFLIHPFGEYSPWIGISTGLAALITAFVCNLPPNRRLVHLRLAVGCALTFAICTCGITTLYLNLVWATKVPFFKYLFTRLFVYGQIWNTLLNSALTVVFLPVLEKIKPLKIKIR